ncbi:subtilisin-like protease SBT1.7 [Cryptomeria japonica]|uniref:subtilisin-like protease SBT1.7 n=1 Tax=Cryptomeria japonica TaxID=3369 RepID=UPI0025AC886C|nr:subtilisin-like protease SBT1.7 [Cryptomeria japonica]
MRLVAVNPDSATFASIFPGRVKVGALQRSMDIRPGKLERNFVRCCCCSYPGRHVCKMRKLRQGFTVVGAGTLVPTVAVFSSRGPSGGYPFILKPDMIAPGVNILAAVRNDYDFKSGTSMATPHVTGIAALIKVLHPMWSPAATKSALMTSSYIVDNTNQPIADLSTVLEADPFATGAGHIDPEAAVDPGLVYDMEAQDYINFLCFLNYTKQQIALLSNASCPSSTLAVIDLNYPSFTMLLKSDSQSVEVDYSIGYRRNSKAASPMADDRPDRQRRIHRISA